MTPDKMMAGAWIFIASVLWGAGYAQLHRPGCPLDRIHVAPDFDINRFLGRWNEILWVAPVEERGYESTDFYHEYRKTSTGLVGYENGRDVPSGNCFSGYFNLSESDTPGVLWLQPANNPRTIYYVMEVNYTSYANVYGCMEYDATATMCYRGRAWLWSRGPDLPNDMVSRVVNEWGKLCLDLEDLLKRTPHPGNDCPRDDA